MICFAVASSSAISKDISLRVSGTPIITCSGLNRRDAFFWISAEDFPSRRLDTISAEYVVMTSLMLILRFLFSFSLTISTELMNISSSVLSEY